MSHSQVDTWEVIESVRAESGRAEPEEEPHDGASPRRGPTSSTAPLGPLDLPPGLDGGHPTEPRGGGDAGVRQE